MFLLVYLLACLRTEQNNNKNRKETEPGLVTNNGPSMLTGAGRGRPGAPVTA